MTSRVSKNVLVNFLGRGWGAFLSIAFTPLYIKFLGMEAYGLIGVFITLQALLGILDMGLGTAANREMAVLSASEGNLPKIRNFVRTLEWIYWAMAICIAIAVGLSAYPIAHIWIKPQTLQPHEITAAIILMGVVLAVQWPTGLYGGALMGLQQQTSLNVLTALFSTVRSVGAVLILWKVSSSVISFFVWNAFVIVIQTLVIAWYLWRQIRQTNHKPVFEKKLLYEARKFAVEMSGITLMAVAFTQLDKVVLSRVLTLQSFGYYYAASVAAGSLYILISPIFSAIFPKFSQLVSQKEREQIRSLYDQASQLMAITILPLMMILIFFSYDLLLIWTHNKLTAESGVVVLGLLAVGNALNGLMNVPYALQLATGDAKPVLKINACLITISTPAVIFLANRWGGEGAAIAWVGYTLAFWIINTFIVNKQFPDLDIRSLIWNGVIKPVSVAFVMVALGYMVQWRINSPSQWVNFMIITFTTIAALFATALSSPAVIRYIKSRR
jgi:O-antigen/teichoic acid export membrane protein